MDEAKTDLEAGSTGSRGDNGNTRTPWPMTGKALQSIGTALFGAGLLMGGTVITSNGKNYTETAREPGSKDGVTTEFERNNDFDDTRRLQTGLGAAAAAVGAIAIAAGVRWENGNNLFSAETGKKPNATPTYRGPGTGIQLV